MKVIKNLLFLQGRMKNGSLLPKLLEERKVVRNP